MLPLCGEDEMSEKPDERGESAEQEKDGESGGVGSVVAKSLVSISACVSKLTSGTFNICDRFRSSSRGLILHWSSGARNSEDCVLDDRDRSGRWVILNFDFPSELAECIGGESIWDLTCEEAGLTNSGESIGGGLSAGRDAGVSGIEKFCLGRSIVVTGASALTLVGA